MQLWTQTVASPRRTMRAAAEAEQAGWAGLTVVDSQNLSGDPFVVLALAATTTERLGPGPSGSGPRSLPWPPRLSVMHGATVGPPQRCATRFEELAALGLDTVVVAAQFQLDETEEGRASKKRLEANVLRAFA